MMIVNSLISLIKNKLLAKFDDQTLCNQYANWLMQAITQKSEIELITAQEIEWTNYHQAQLDDALDKLINQNMPLAYLLGSMPFAGLDIMVHPPILIPRSETEEWVCDLIDLLKSVRIYGAKQMETSPLGSFGASGFDTTSSTHHRPSTTLADHPEQAEGASKGANGGDSNEPLAILDLCTGSGCIALAFADAFPKAKVYATDISDTALNLAAQNAKHNQITNVTFLHSDLFEAIPKDLKFDLIVANPPYIPEVQWNSLEPSVKNWEDKKALIAPDQGMALVKKIIDAARDYLKPNELLKKNNIPQLAIEIDATQGAALSTYLKNHGYTQVTIAKDLEGKDRLATGRVDYVASPAHS